MRGERSWPWSLCAWAGSLSGLLSSLHAGVLMQYVGVPFTTVGGTLSAAHHVEAVAEFQAVGDPHPTSIAAKVLDSSGDVLLYIPSVGPVGTALWTGVFVWEGDLIREWSWVVSTTGVYPEDYISSLHDPAGPWSQDQAIDEHLGTQGFDGIAEVFNPGEWSSIPEAPAPAFATAFGLVAVMAGWRRRVAA